MRLACQGPKNVQQDRSGGRTQLPAGCCRVRTYDHPCSSLRLIAYMRSCNSWQGTFAFAFCLAGFAA